MATSFALLLALTFQNTAPAAALAHEPADPTPESLSRLWWGDFDRDGLPDVFVGAAEGAGQLLRNLGEGAFEEVTLASGLAGIDAPSTAVWEDFDGDGWVDLLVGSFQSGARLFRNLDGGSLAEVGEASGLGEAGCVLEARAGDFDLDGRIDLHLVTDCGDRVYRNLGESAFERLVLPATGGLGASSASGPARGPTSGGRSIAPAANPDADSAGSTVVVTSEGVPTSRPERSSRSATPFPSRPPGTESLLPSGCFPTIQDQAGGCLQASTLPLYGKLYPLGPEFNIDPAGHVGIGLTSPSYKLHVQAALPDSRVIYARHGSTSGTVYGVYGSTPSPDGTAVFGEHTALTGITPAVHGVSASSDFAAPAIRGDATATTGATIGVRGANYSTLGTGVRGDAFAFSGATYGVHGSSVSPDGTGVYGIHSSTTGDEPGVRGVSSSTDGSAIGVRGEAADRGVEGVASVDYGVGVQGRNTLVSPPTFTIGAFGWAEATNDRGIGVAGGVGATPYVVLNSGVSGVASESAPGGNGVAGYATSPTGESRAVSGINASDTGTGVYGEHAATTGSTPGVHGITNSTDLYAPGVRGESFTAGGIGVEGRIDGSSGGSGGSGVAGYASGLTGASHGVFGVNDSPSGMGVRGWAASLTGATIGVHGAGRSPDGTGVYGQHQATSGMGVGVHGATSSVDLESVGVLGEVTAGSGYAMGVWGKTGSADGFGVAGSVGSGATVLTGAGVSGSTELPGSTGVFGYSDATGARGVYGQSAVATGVLGESDATSGAFAGVYGQTSSPDGGAAGVYGVNLATTGFPRGIQGVSAASTGRALFGDATSSTGANIGVSGRTFSATGFGVFSTGAFGGTGAKYFIQPHPTDASKEIRFVCLEGNESGTYFRGSSRLAKGKAVIEVPEEFRLASEREHLTVQVSPVGAPAALWIQEKSLERIVVRGDADIEFDYFVNGVRYGYGEHKAIVDNVAYVPEERGRPYGTQYPPAIQELLIANGTLNPDLTPNEATAARLGWRLRDPAAIDPPEESRIRTLDAASRRTQPASEDRPPVLRTPRPAPAPTPAPHVERIVPRSAPAKTAPATSEQGTAGQAPQPGEPAPPPTASPDSQGEI